MRLTKHFEEALLFALVAHDNQLRPNGWSQDEKGDEHPREQAANLQGKPRP